MQKDLLTKTGHCLEDVGRTVSWGALGAFLHKLDVESEVAREIEPEIASWASRSKTNAILADIYDVLSIINANLYAIGTKSIPARPEKYPRPNNKEKQKIGNGAMPPEELRAWFESKRKRKEDG